ncbi:transcriptional regulator, LacI family [Longilinea arvoryzae]|uniref:Transcriptional regulator, LacI family n=1 Tax=Longilinea arvoryzae TaxID=360412 RepID=A0A0S7BML4_9CHLR|nr:LacI family DNA-binding transcriptional regulator [Longilinea arvoryzae]GAP14954.1 transcriptional regulator, LacI family [Longilinea arvoryzae]
MPRVTIKDVARAAQVSITTVSHVVNNTRFVDPATKQRVLTALEELGYQPNSLARSLRSGVTRTIGLVVPDASNLFFADVARKIEDIGFQQGYSVILCNSDNNPGKQSRYINTLLAKQVDGVIFISSGSEPDDLMRLVENNIPVVVADRDVPLELADVVLLDNEQAGYDATKHLINLGHRFIACITGPNHLAPSMQRFEGYKRCLKENGIDFDPKLIEMGDFRFPSGEEAMQRLLSSSSRATAVFVLNDMMAIGAMSAAHKAGLSIPKDISIIGFDDIEIDAAITPALTTMAQPIEEMAQYAMNLLIEHLVGKKHELNQRIILTSRLIKRDSTARWEE